MLSSIAHLDLDAFFAAVELHRHPELRGKPVVVGGNPDGRGVVATASYEARRYGIRSAMSSAEARRRCPDVVFVRPDHRTYREWSRRVWALVRDMAPVVEQVGIDEGYLVLPDGDPREQAALVQLAVRERMRLSCSLGVATCKVVAKIGLGRAQAGRHHRRPARRRGGVPGAAAGARAARRRPEGGGAARRGGRRHDRRPGRARRRAGSRRSCRAASASSCARRARGIDPRPVSGEPAEAVSISNEETFDVDVRDREELHAPPAADGRGAGGVARAARDERAHGDDEAALPGLRHRHPVAEPRGRHRRRRDDRRPRLQPARPGATPAARGRSGWWASASRGSTGTSSSRCR